MNGLYPIIRRARRSLYPPDDSAPAAPSVVVELPPLIPVVETSVETVPVETVPVALVEKAPIDPPAPVVSKAKKTKRSANPPV